jgi:hypothetical protein
MVETSLVFDGKVVHAGIFDFKEVYKFLYEWISSYQYTILETKYSEKVKAEGKELEVVWLCLRKLSDYFRYKITIVTRVFYMTSVEVMREGVKVKRDKGELEIKIKAFLERDYEHRWETNPITKFFRGLYDKYVIRSRIELYEDELLTEVNEMVAQSKAFMMLEGKR